MSPLPAAALILLFMAALACGTPVFAVIGGGAALLFALVSDVSTANVIIEMNRLANAPGIVAVPLFIFTGFLLSESNASHRLIRLSNAMFGWIPGGAAVVAVLVCTVFTALTGGSGITIVAVGGVLMPSLVRQGYGRKFSTGIITASGSSGVLFVPSLAVIIYGMVTGTDIGNLFLAGVLPGALIISFLSGFGMVYGICRRVPVQPFCLGELKASIREIKWMVPLPFLILIGIYGGLISVAEAACVSAVYALVTECTIYREIKGSQLGEVAVKSMVMVGAILIILGTALALTNFMVDRQIPQKIMAGIISRIPDKVVFLLMLNLFLLIVGCLMDIFSAIVVVAPLIAPAAEVFDIDPVHLGIIFLANLEVGYLTPPVGINLFIANLRFNIPVVQLYKTVIPFLLLLVAALLLISYLPDISLFLLEITGRRELLLEI
ncbi:MAG: TRAP transporter large permease subunit [Desulfobacter sp.]|nr:MAG: TRAP transporter large permease subunit [Desulfobacter sp.]